MLAALLKSKNLTGKSQSSNDTATDDLVAQGKRSPKSNSLFPDIKSNNNNSTSKLGVTTHQQHQVTLPPELAQAFQIIEWDPEIYGVGVRSIDDQHQQLIATMAKLCVLGKHVGTLSPINPNMTSSNSNQVSGNSNNQSNRNSSPTKGSVVSPMTIRGAFGLDSKVFDASKKPTSTNEEGEENNNTITSKKNFSSSTTSIPATATKRRSSISMRNGGDNNLDNNNNDSDDVKNSIIRVHGHRVTLPEGGFRSIDRGHPLDLQKGGRIEPLLDALVQHCSVRLIQEEHAFEAVSFSDRIPHSMEHQIFVREVFRAYQLMEQYNFELNDLVKLIKFLKNWFKDHIPKDRRYAPLIATGSISRV